LALGTLGSIGLSFALTKMAQEMAKFADQGLGEMLLKYANEELHGYYED
jgi:hypothetical protein